jgi:hypothetical protein
LKEINLIENVSQLLLCLIKHHAMKMHGGKELELHAFLASAPDAPVPGTHYIGGWVGPRAAVDGVEEIRIF